ncbi:MAG: type II toxin-antitoxin system prevent-host-death family antitoxin [Gammaproteobacteria bacterium]|nr:type II toxin-antitoxin system prevent-host-death family antitoxin [Gammaproteobacteria bacterium]
MEKQLTLTDAKARFSEVIDKVSEGDEVLITRMGEPVAVISRYVPA